MMTMRAGVSSVQQTLTPEAASVLKHAVAEACRRGHAQATPLHVAATLLGAHGSPLREACLRTHPAHSSPLPQCRALELCFNIALERLQAAQGPLPGGQPSYSNALVAALKRAQAHQRRGCPEQQQQPLLAVKVELEQLVISILDDPSVSRVMREAGFNSTDVKNHLEETVSLMTPHHTATISPNCGDHQSRLSLIDQVSFRLGSGTQPPFTLPFPHPLPAYGRLHHDRSDAIQPHHLRPPSRIGTSSSLYANPRFAKPVGIDAQLLGGAAAAAAVSDDSKRVLDVLLQSKRRNPLLVGESAANVDVVVRDVMQRLERGDVPEQLKGVKVLTLKLTALSVLSASKEELKMKFVEMGESVQELKRFGVIIHLGDLQWLVQLRRSTSISSRLPSDFCPVAYAVQEISDLLARHKGLCNGRLWLMSFATNHTFYGLQSQHSHLEHEWELQLVPITLASRFKIQESGVTGVDSSLTLSLRPSPTTSVKVISLDEEEPNESKFTCCSECAAKYEKEALALREQERLAASSGSPPSCSSSVETPSKETSDSVATLTSQSNLPAWLRKALPTNTTNKVECLEAKEKPLAERIQELLRRWNQTCRSLHGPQNVAPSTPPEKMQQPSPSSSQVSGGIFSRCQDRPFSLLMDNKNRPVHSRQAVALFAAAAGESSQRLVGTQGLAMPLSLLQNGVTDQRQINAFKERVRDSTGCSPSRAHLPWQVSASNCIEEGSAPLEQGGGHPARNLHRLDVEALTRLCKGLAERVGWQKGVISTIANTVMQCRSGMSKRHWVGFKGDAWLLLLGPDKVGKRKMAEALAELIFGCEKKPVCLKLGMSSQQQQQQQQQELSLSSGWGLGPVPSRGKMPLDQVSDAVRQNPSSLVLMVEDIEQADFVCKMGLLKAMQRGRFQDSKGGEVSLNNAIVLLTSSVGIPEGVVAAQTTTDAQPVKGQSDANGSYNCLPLLESSHDDPLASSGKRKGEWEASSGKRKGEWDSEADCGASVLGHNCKKKASFLGRALSLDLNMSIEDDDADYNASIAAACEGSREEKRPEPVPEEQVLLSASKHLKEFYDLVDAAVVFANAAPV